MHVWHGLAVVGLGALAVATMAFTGTVVTPGWSRVAAIELTTVAYVSFFTGVFALGAATLVRGTTQIRGVLRTARRAN